MTISIFVVNRERIRANAEAKRSADNVRYLMDVLNNDLLPTIESINEREDMRPLTTQLLERLLAQYQKVVDENPTRPDIQFSAAKAFRRAVSIEHGSIESRLAIIGKAIRILEKLNNEFPENRDYQLELAEAHLASVKCHGEDETEAIVKSAKKIAEALIETNDPEPEYFDCLLKALTSLGRFKFTKGEFTVAKHYFDQTEKVQQEQAKQWPDLVPTMADIKRHSMISMFCYFTNHFEREARHSRIALRLVEQRLADENLSTTERKEAEIRRCDVVGAVGEGLFRKQEYEQGLDLINEALAVGNSLLERYPDNVQQRRLNAWVYNRIGNAMMVLGRHAEAVSALTAAVESLEGDTDPSFLAGFQYRLGSAHWYLGNQSKGASLFQQVVQGHRSRTDFMARWRLALLLTVCPDPDIRDPEETIKILEGLDGAMNSEQTLGVAHYRCGNYQTAINYLQETMKKRNGGDAFDWVFLSMSYWQCGKEREARHWYAKVMKAIEEKRPFLREVFDSPYQLESFRKEAETLMGV